MPTAISPSSAIAASKPQCRVCNSSRIEEKGAKKGRFIASEFRFDSEMLANPSNRIDHLTIVGGAEIIHLRAMLRVARGVVARHLQNRGKAILNIKITLSLGPIAQNAEMVGMLYQLSIEIKNVPVSIAFA